MPLVRWTQHLARYGEATPMNVEGRTLREVLDAAFRERPSLRSFVLDEQGNVRPHVVLFIDGQQSRDRTCLQDEVSAEAVIDVLQALSGG